MTQTIRDIKSEDGSYLPKIDQGTLTFLREWFLENSKKARDIFQFNKGNLMIDLSKRKLSMDSQRLLVNAVTFDPQLPERLKGLFDTFSKLSDSDSISTLIPLIKSREGVFFFVEDIDKFRVDDTEDQAAALWFWYLVGRDPIVYLGDLLKVNGHVNKYNFSESTRSDLREYARLAITIATIAVEVRDKLMEEESGGDTAQEKHIMNGAKFQMRLFNELSIVWKQLFDFQNNPDI